MNCAVTSPPYWGLRGYGTPPEVWGGDPNCRHRWGDIAKIIVPFCVNCDAWRGSLGLEPTPELYVAHLVEVFRELRRVLRNDGTLWLNLGDSYATGGGKVGNCPGGGAQGERWTGFGRGMNTKNPKWAAALGPISQPSRMPIAGLKPKDLVGIPWRVAFALQADGW